MKIALFVPVRNEIEGLKLILPQIDRSWIDEVICIDGQSTDGSFEYLQANGWPVFRQRGKGICDAYWQCVELAKSDAIIAFSPDNNSLPNLIPDVVAKLRAGKDMVIVSRYLDGAKSEDDDPVTAFGNWMFTTMVNLCFDAKYTDSLVMFRGFKKSLPYELQMDERYLPLFEMQLTIRCAKAQRNVMEIPGDEPKRIGGVRKMRPLYNGSAVLWLIVKELFCFRPQVKK